MRIINVDPRAEAMGFITAVTALTPEVGGASGKWDLATDEIA